MEITIANWKKYFFYIFFLFFSFSPLLDLLMPIKVSGVSFFNSFLPSILILVFYLVQFVMIKNKEHVTLFILTIFTLLVLIIQVLTFNSDTLEKIIIARRYLFLTPLYIIVIKSMIQQLNVKVLIYIVFASLIFSSITAILYILGRPTIRILSPEFNEVDYERFGGIWGGANVFASILILQLVMLFFYYRQFYFFKLILFLVVFIAILTTISRGGTLLLLILLPFVLMKKYTFKKYLTVFLIIILAFLGIASLSVFTHVADYIAVLDRFSQENNDIRSSIFSTYAQRLLESPFNLLFGSPSYIQSAGNVEFSDNSFLLLVLDNGIILAIIYGISLLRLIWMRQSFSVFLITGILMLTFFLNNALLWNYYVFISVLAFILISKDCMYIKNMHLKRNSNKNSVKFIPKINIEGV